jgi:hypothetical protein
LLNTKNPFEYGTVPVPVMFVNAGMALKNLFLNACFYLILGYLHREKKFKS